MHYKDETRPARDAVPGSWDQAQDVNRKCINFERARRHERLRAALRRKGYLLIEQANGSFLIARWDRAVDLHDLDAVERLANLIGAKS